MTVIEVGPGAVRVLSGGSGGSGDIFGPDPAVVRAALDWIDDPVGLYDDRPILVADLWRAVVTRVAGGSCDRLVVVHPDDWPRPRLDRVLAAANSVAADVVAVPRSRWTPGEQPDVQAMSPPVATGRAPRWALVGAATVATAMVVAAVWSTTSPGPAVGVPRTVTEGRVVVEVPPDWTATRVTTGPGSHRLQVTSSTDPGIALHITQAYAPEATLAQAAELFAEEIASRPAGLFIGLRSDARVFGRPAVVYREVRAGHIVDWTVVLAGSTRISVGCQSRPESEREVAAACEAAVRSARESGTDPAR